MTIIMLMLFFFYLSLVLFSKKIETWVIFPGVWKKSGVNFAKYWIEEFYLGGAHWFQIHWIFLDTWSPKTIYFFHWNDGPLGDYIHYINYLWSLWYNVMSYDYPGYGESTWCPEEELIWGYTKTFYQYIRRKKNILSKDIIAFWHSLGTVFAMDFSYKYNVNKLVLISPLTSKYDMGKFKYKFPVPRFLFLENGFDNLSKSKHISIPTLVIHWKRDAVIPFKHGSIIFSCLKSRKKFFITINNFWHTGIIKTFGDELKSIFICFFETGILKDLFIELN